MLSRRHMLKLGFFGSGYKLVSAAGLIRPVRRSASLDDIESPPTTPFVDELPVPPIVQNVAPFAAHCGATSASPTGPLPAYMQNTEYKELVEEEAVVGFGGGLPGTPVWRFRDVNTPANSPVGPGPTFMVRQGNSQVVRIHNNLPEDHQGFGVPETTTHLHGGHVPTLSDGFPENVPGITTVIHHGENFDYCFPMRDPGFLHGEPDATERPSTMWYHDHLFDFTGPNVVRGLAGFYLVYDELDACDEMQFRGLRLPSGMFDVPLVIQDRLFSIEDGLAQLVYDPMDHDGFLGDKMTVNGKIQPFMNVYRRKYRFRILNGSNARYLRLVLSNAAGDVFPFDHIATEGGLMSSTIRDVEYLQLSMAERDEIVIDFSDFQEGDVLYLEDLMDQDDGRGPGGTYEDPDLFDVGDGTRVLQFRVGAAMPDRSQVPTILRPFDPISAAEIANATRRHIELERQGGAWAINDEFADMEHPVHVSALNGPEIWTYENKSGGWWHPMHAHVEYGRILTRNEKQPPLNERDGQAKKDTIDLGPNDVCEVFYKFRDFPGATVFHCHNVEHEDMFMMARFDIA